MSTYRAAVDGALGWNSVTDIGRVCSGTILSQEGYLAVESGFIEFAEIGHRSGGGSDLFVEAVETHGVKVPPIPGCVLLPNCLREGTRFEATSLAALVRTCLREIAWYRIRSENGEFALHFGWDFTMFVICPMLPSDCIDSVRRLGIEIVEAPSPYWPS